ncbi:hypothetical protein RA307_24190 [Xanthobacteraceae bacterium Astr-EGSB]|uniref:hypothetical protein n=1 Tax=Astrobacterium formosum TaxID=3069710 RepID=UPI0027B86FC5|nr:hypothetical protein [Xanthobacteraceae bacterium Astr-EGSB]
MEREGQFSGARKNVVLSAACEFIDELFTVTIGATLTIRAGEPGRFGCRLEDFLIAIRLCKAPTRVCPGFAPQFVARLPAAHRPSGMDRKYRRRN